MNTATLREDPGQLLLGGIVELRRQARQRGQTIFAFIADCIEPAVVTVQDLRRELEREAVLVCRLGDEFLAADGVIDAGEWCQLRGVVAEMGEEAKQGRALL